MSRAEVYEDKSGNWRYRVVGANGEIMVGSQAYSSKSNAHRGLGDLASAFNAINPVVSSGAEIEYEWGVVFADDAGHKYVEPYDTESDARLIIRSHDGEGESASLIKRQVGKWIKE